MHKIAEMIQSHDHHHQSPCCVKTVYAFHDSILMF